MVYWPVLVLDPEMDKRGRLYVLQALYIIKPGLSFRGSEAIEESKSCHQPTRIILFGTLWMTQILDPSLRSG